MPPGLRAVLSNHRRLLHHLAMANRPQQIHGTLMHPGIREAKAIMAIQPLQVIKAIGHQNQTISHHRKTERASLVLRKLAKHPLPNSINQKIQKHRKYWLIHLSVQLRADKLRSSRGKSAIPFTICVRRPCRIAERKNIEIGTDLPLLCQWFGSHSIRI